MNVVELVFRHDPPLKQGLLSQGFIMLLQLVPVMPAGQVQVKVVGLFFVQLPPFQHGWLSQGFNSVVHVAPA